MLCVSSPNPLPYVKGCDILAKCYCNSLVVGISHATDMDLTNYFYDYLRP